MSDVPRLCLSRAGGNGQTLISLSQRSGDISQLTDVLLSFSGTLFSQESLTCGSWSEVDCTVQGVKILTGLVEAWEHERDFLDSGAEMTDPLRDLPWRFRDMEA